MATSTTAARAKELTKSYPVGPGRVIAIREVSFDIERGKFTSLFGPFGSGKTPLVNCLSGLEPASSGEAWIGDHEVTALSEKELTRLRRHSVGVAFRYPILVPTLTVEENLLLPLSIAGRNPDPAWFKGLVTAAELTNLLPSPAGELPASLQQRVSVARAIIARPELVVADEPTGNLASTPARGLIKFLRRCVEEFGLTVLLATHDPVIAAAADRSLLLFDGQLAGDEESPSAHRLAARLAELSRIR